MELVGPCLEDGEIQITSQSSELDTTWEKGTRQTKGDLEKNSGPGKTGTKQDMTIEMGWTGPGWLAQTRGCLILWIELRDDDLCLFYRPNPYHGWVDWY